MDSLVTIASSPVYSVISRAEKFLKENNIAFDSGFHFPGPPAPGYLWIKVHESDLALARNVLKKNCGMYITIY